MAEWQLKLDNNTQVFFALVRAGLWEQEVRLLLYGKVDFDEVYRFAEKQSLIGLVAAGIENVTDAKIPQVVALSYAGAILQLEQRNIAMNQFISKLIDRLKKEGVQTLLVKGQGIAQCYEKPLWRASGDVDLFLDDIHYQKAAITLLSLASCVEEEDSAIRHLAMTIGSWKVELHGSLCSKIRKSVDNGLMEIQDDTFKNKRFRIWKNNNTVVYLPSVDNDIVFVFSHIYQHFFKEGIGLRQICDWCRLLWTYKDSIDKELLEHRLNRMHLMNKWCAFAALVVDYLGMPEDAMPFYSPAKKWRKKGDRIIFLILESGNFGHAIDKSYKYKYPMIIRVILAFAHHTSIAFRHFLIFPYDSFRGWLRLMCIGVRANLNNR